MFDMVLFARSKLNAVLVGPLNVLCCRGWAGSLRGGPEVEELCAGDWETAETGPGAFLSAETANREGSFCMLRMAWFSQLTSSCKRVSWEVTVLYSSESLKFVEQQFGA